MQELLRSQWNYMLYQDEDKYLLSAMCGTVGLYEINIYLNKDEEENYKSTGKDYIEELAKQIRNFPSEFQDRHIEMPVD